MEKVPWSASKSLGRGAAGNSILRSIGLSTLTRLALKTTDACRLLHAFLIRSSLIVPLQDSVVNVSSK